MSIINQASKRLEQLRQAGVELPWADSPPMPEPTPAAPAAAPTAPVVEVNAAPAPAVTAAPTPAIAPVPAPAPAPAAPVAVPSPSPAASVVHLPTKAVAAPMPVAAVPAAAPAVPAAPARPIPEPAPKSAAVAAPAPAAAKPAAAPVATAATTRNPLHSDTIELDLAALAQRKLLVPGCDDRALINEFRAIKRPLVTNAMGANAANVKRGNVIVVTSAMPGEGKTYCAINLALSMAAQVDNTVLLIDADVVKPALSQRLGLPPAFGLLDLLAENPRPMREVLLRTNLPKLSIIPSSAPRPDSAERISSDRMQALVTEMAERYPDRIIVIDAPPLLLTNESRVLTSLAGQVVMVVEAGRTTRRAVQDAFQAVESCPVVMSVLNKRSQALRGYGYGYGYGDGY